MRNLPFRGRMGHCLFKDRSVLPAVDSTSVGKRVVEMFAQIKYGQRL